MRVFWAAFCVAVFACLYSFRVGASEPVVGTGPVCDTENQTIMMATIVDSMGLAAAMKAVNDDANDQTACIVATVAFVKGEAIVTVNGKHVVTKITIIGAVINGQLMPLPPKEFYTLFPAEGRPA